MRKSVYGGKSGISFGVTASRLLYRDEGENYRVIIGVTNIPIPTKANVGT